MIVNERRHGNGNSNSNLLIWSFGLCLYYCYLIINTKLNNRFEIYQNFIDILFDSNIQLAKMECRDG